MICPVCDGRGEVGKHFLWIFRWRGRCRRCGGIGWLEEDGSRAGRPPAIAAPDRRRESFREWTDDDRSTWLSRESSSGRAEPFVAGSEGRSGGGGGGATWDDAAAAGGARGQADREHPVIVDPFVGDGAAVAAADRSAAPIAEALDSGSASADSSSSENSGSSDGTSY
jgi:hypothetical protein